MKKNYVPLLLTVNKETLSDKLQIQIDRGQELLRGEKLIIQTEDDEQYWISYRSWDNVNKAILQASFNDINNKNLTEYCGSVNHIIYSRDDKKKGLDRTHFIMIMNKKIEILTSIKEGLDLIPTEHNIPQLEKVIIELQTELHYKKPMFWYGMLTGVLVSAVIVIVGYLIYFLIN